MSQGTITYTIKVDNSAVGPAIDQTKSKLNEAASSATSFGTKLKSATDVAGNVATLATGALLLAFSWDSVQQAQIRAAKAQQSLKDKQDAAKKAQIIYNDAVAKFGVNSPQAVKALDDLKDANNRVKIATENADLKQKDLNQSYAFFATSAVTTAISSFSSLEGVIGRIAKSAPGLTTALGDKTSGLSGALEGVSGGSGKVAGAIEGIGFALLIVQTGIAAFDSFVADFQTFTDLSKGDFSKSKENITGIVKGLSELPVIGVFVEQFGKLINFQGELDKIDPVKTAKFWDDTAKGITGFGTAIASVFTQTLPTWWDSFTKNPSKALADTYNSLATAVGGFATAVGKLFSGDLKLPDWWGSITKGFGALTQGKNPFAVEAQVTPKVDQKVLQDVRNNITKATTIPPSTVIIKGDTKPLIDSGKKGAATVSSQKPVMKVGSNVTGAINTAIQARNKINNMKATIQVQAHFNAGTLKGFSGGVRIAQKGMHERLRQDTLILAHKGEQVEIDKPHKMRSMVGGNVSAGDFSGGGNGGFYGQVNVYVDGVQERARYSINKFQGVMK